MLYELGYRTGIKLGAEVESLEFTISTASLTPELLSVDRGGIILNGVRVGTSTPVEAGDKVRIYVNASNAFSIPTYVNLTQDGDPAGTFIVLSAADSTAVFDVRYEGLEPYEVLPDSTWTPSNERNVLVLNSSDLSVADTIAVSNTPLQTVPAYRVHVHDYHRDMTYILDGVDGSFQGIVPTTLQGPVSDAAIFNTSIQRIATAIAYRKSNKVVIYDNYYGVIAEIDSTDPIKVEASENILYVLEKGATAVRVLTFDNALGYVESQVSYGSAINDFVVFGGELAVIAGDVLHDFDGTTYPAMINEGFKLFYSEASTTLVVTHGLQGRITYYGGTTGSRVYKTIKSDTFAYPTYMDNKARNGAGTLYLDDALLRIMQQSSPDPSNGFTLGAELDGPAYGILQSGDLVFVPNLYQDIDAKMVFNDTTVDLVNFGEHQLSQLGGSVLSDVVTVSGITAAVNLYIPPDFIQDIQLIIDGTEYPVGTNQASLVEGTTIQLKATTVAESAGVLQLPVIIGQSVFEWKLFPAEPYILPYDTMFRPAVALGPSVEMCSLPNTITGLGDGETIEVTTDAGVLVVNGNRASGATTQTVQDGDTLSICIESSPNSCGVVDASITYGDRFTTVFSVVTPEEVDPVVALLNLYGADDFDIGKIVHNVELGDSIISSPAAIVLDNEEASVTVSIPDIYDSFLVVNGVQVGHSATVNHGDEIQVGLTATYNYYTDHIIPIRFCNTTFYFVGKTVPDYVPDNFYFGFQDGLHIADRVLSDEVTVSGLMSGVDVPMVVPYGTVPIVNGSHVAISPPYLDYRGVLVEDYVISVQNGDVIQLDGYPRPYYGSLQVFEARIGYRTGIWELGTYTLEEGANRNEKRIQTINGPDAVRSFFREPVLVEHEKKTYGLSTSTSPVKVASAETSTVAQSAFVVSPQRQNIVNLSVAARSETEITAVKVTESTVTSPTSEPSAVPNSSLEAFGNNNAFIDFANQHPEYFIGADWEKSSGAHQESFQGPDVSTVRTYSEVYSTEFRNEFVQWSQPTLTLNGEVEWIPVPNRAPVKAKLDVYTALVYDQKGFSKFENGFWMQPVVAPVLFGTGFDTYVRPDLVTVNDRTWVEYDSYNEVHFNRPDSVILRQDADVVYTPEYEVWSRHAEVLSEPVWVKDQSRTEPVKAARVFDKAFNNPTVSFEKEYVKSSSSSPALFTGSSQIHDQKSLVTYKGVSVVVEPGQQVLSTPISGFKSPAPTVITMSAQPDVVYGPCSTSHLAGTFATIEDAEADAVSRGLQVGSVDVVSYEDRYIWIRKIACANMCYECPSAGYIQGG